MAMAMTTHDTHTLQSAACKYYINVKNPSERANKTNRTQLIMDWFRRNPWRILTLLSSIADRTDADLLYEAFEDIKWKNLLHLILTTDMFPNFIAFRSFTQMCNWTLLNEDNFVLCRCKGKFASQVSCVAV